MVPRDLRGRLAHYRAMTMAPMLAAVPQREPSRYLYGPISEHLSRVGKSLRPSLCLATCRAFGGDHRRALRSAVALEMLHNAFLIHDDVEDESELRRGLPTLHAEHGVPLAVNAGDTLNALAMRLLRGNLEELGSELAWRIYEEFDHLLMESLEGQAMELGWVRDNRCNVTEEDYLLMGLKKTCWYSFMHPCRLGALIAQGPGVDVDRFNRFGYFLGTAFQIQDDILNLVGDPDRYGKEIAGDLLEGKRTLMLIHLFRSLNDTDVSRLRNFLGHPRRERSEADVQWILAKMDEHGSIARARTVAKHFAGATLYEFTRAFAGVPDSDDKSFVHDIVHYMIARDV